MQLFVRIKLPWPRHNVHFFNINTTTLAGVNFVSRKKQWNVHISMIFIQIHKRTKEPVNYTFRLIMNLPRLHDLLSVKEAN